jgi:hypothetical protein
MTGFHHRNIVSEGVDVSLHLKVLAFQAKRLPSGYYTQPFSVAGDALIRALPAPAASRHLGPFGYGH